MSSLNRTSQPEQGTIQSRGFFSPRCCHTGGTAAQATADFSNSTPASTELYLAEICVPFACKVRGVSVFNGSDVTDNIKAALFDNEGNLIAGTASTTGAGTDAYQALPFVTDSLGATLNQLVISPGTYYIGTCYASNTSRFNTHTIGVFAAGKVTGLVFATNFAAAGTALTIAVPRTFTTALGPVATLY